ncbi:hypothetical protein E3N88_15435 [Mikania micrantha]|uniref:BHLH domain-containing protein n=1 Tax=Mikania micrantha TaxID=192012 RepID=A0A5N6NYL5_9ASTR|nr:hypothetical protein E3N88_15435 [Mikania micrantha]
MEASSFHHHPHPFLLDQCLSLSDTIATGFHQPYEHGSIEVISSHQNQAFIANNLQMLDSSMSMAVHDHKSEMKMPSTDPVMAAKTASKRRRQKKNIDDQEKKKKIIDSKEEGQIGYIHVRARRGEATDSHSLAERVRREKISKKMKALQSIVPGCDKIIGKALLLDEVINYVHSLQNEIQILSSKLASVDSMLCDYGTEYEEFMLKSYDENMITTQQHLVSYHEHHMPCMISQDNVDLAKWELEEQRKELDDLFAIINCNALK